MEIKQNCKFCQRAKKKYPKWIYASLYIMGLAIWGQIELIKLIIKFFNS